MSKHTPGPWRAKHDSVTVGRFNVCPYVTAGGSARGLIDEREIAFANARLIAAAPDLLDALNNILVGMEASGGWVGDDGLFDAGMAAYKKATAP